VRGARQKCLQGKPRGGSSCTRSLHLSLHSPDVLWAQAECGHAAGDENCGLLNYLRLNAFRLDSKCSGLRPRAKAGSLPEVDPQETPLELTACPNTLFAARWRKIPDHLERRVKEGTLPEVDPQEKPRGWFIPLQNFLTLRNGTVIVLRTQDESRHAAGGGPEGEAAGDAGPVVYLRGLGPIAPREALTLSSNEGYLSLRDQRTPHLWNFVHLRIHGPASPSEVPAALSQYCSTRCSSRFLLLFLDPHTCGMLHEARPPAGTLPVCILELLLWRCRRTGRRSRPRRQ